MTKPPAYSVYQEFEENIDMLSNEEAGLLYKAQNKYFFHDEPPDFREGKGEGLKYTWPTIKSKLERDKRKYALECVKRAYAADMKNRDPEDPLTYASWYEWRGVRYKGVTDPVLDGFTLEDMLLLDSQKAYRDAKKTHDTM